MIECVFGSYPILFFIRQQPLEQVKSDFSQRRHGQVRRRLCRRRQFLLEKTEERVYGPFDALKLVALGLPSEKHPVEQELRHGGPHRPHVDRTRVVALPAEDLRGHVPQCPHAGTVFAPRKAGREPKVADLDIGIVAQ